MEQYLQNVLCGGQKLIEKLVLRARQVVRGGETL